MNKRIMIALGILAGAVISVAVSVNASPPVGLQCLSGGAQYDVACDTSGNVKVVSAGTGTTSDKVQGAGAAGAAVSGNPVLIGGSDGTNTRTAKTDSSGNQVVIGAGTAGTANSGVVTVQGIASMTPVFTAGPAADGAAVSSNPVRIGGKDGSGNTQDILTDTSGLLRIEGSAAAGAAAGGTWGTPVTVACSSGSATSSATLTAGQVYEMTSDIDVYIKIGAGAATTDRPLWAKTYLYARQVATGGSAGVISCRTASGSGTLSLSPITTAE